MGFLFFDTNRKDRSYKWKGVAKILSTKVIFGLTFPFRKKTHCPLKIKANLIQSVTITMHRIREVAKRLAEIQGLEKTAITRRRIW